MAQGFKETLGGRFIVLDGPDGCGKSTQQRLLSEALAREGLEVSCVRDPGTTTAGEGIRQILLSGDHGSLDPRCELLLFMAARAQMIAECIRPALAAGRVVLGDRFVSASCAYQGASGLDPAQIVQIGHFAIGGRWPDLTIVLDVPAELGMERIRKTEKAAALDAMERRPLDFHRRVREMFLNLGRVYPAPVAVIDATVAPEVVHQRILEVLDRVDH